MNTNLSRRRLMQLLTVTMMGSPFSSEAIAESSQKELPDIGKPVFIPPGGGDKGKVGDSDIIFKLDKAQTAGHLGSWEMILLPGLLGAPPHHHKNYDEILFVQEGIVHVLVGEEVYEVKAGGWHLRPRGITHTFWNSETTAAKFIDMCVPGGHEDYMKDLAKLFENGRRPQPREMTKLAEKHDQVWEFDKLQGIMDKYKVHL